MSKEQELNRISSEPVELLEHTKEAYLSEICHGGTYVFESGKILQLPARYQDAARMVAYELAGIAKRWNQDEAFPENSISMEVYNVFVFLCLLAGEEASRRMIGKKINFCDCEDLSRVIPALAMPLPELFRAAYESNADPVKKMFFKTAYGRYLDFLEFDPKLIELAESSRKKQPDLGCDYYDVATMARTLLYANHAELVPFDLLAQLLYNLLVLPFVEDAPLPISLPDE